MDSRSRDKDDDDGTESSIHDLGNAPSPTIAEMNQSVSSFFQGSAGSSTHRSIGPGFGSAFPPPVQSPLLRGRFLSSSVSSSSSQQASSVLRTGPGFFLDLNSNNPHVTASPRTRSGSLNDVFGTHQTRTRGGTGGSLTSPSKGPNLFRNSRSNSYDGSQRLQGSDSSFGLFDLLGNSASKLDVATTQQQHQPSKPRRGKKKDKDGKNSSSHREEIQQQSTSFDDGKSDSQSKMSARGSVSSSTKDFASVSSSDKIERDSMKRYEQTDNNNLVTPQKSATTGRSARHLYFRSTAFSPLSWLNRSSSEGLSASSSSIPGSNNSSVRTDSYSSRVIGQNSFLHMPEVELLEVEEEEEDDGTTEHRSVRTPKSHSSKHHDSPEDSTIHSASNQDSPVRSKKIEENDRGDDDNDDTTSSHNQKIIEQSEGTTNESETIFQLNEDESYTEGSGGTGFDYHERLDAGQRKNKAPITYEAANLINNDSYRLSEVDEEDEEMGNEVTFTEDTDTSVDILELGGGTTNPPVPNYYASYGSSMDYGDTMDDEEDDDFLAPVVEEQLQQQQPRMGGMSATRSKRGSLPRGRQTLNVSFDHPESENNSRIKHNRGSFPRATAFEIDDTTGTSNPENAEDYDTPGRDRSDSQSTSGNVEGESQLRERNLSSTKPSSYFFCFICCTAMAMHRASVCIVTKTPCFWFSSYPYTDKAVLSRLNALAAFCAAIIIGITMYLFIVLLAPGITERDLPDSSKNEDDEQSEVYGASDIFLTTTWNQNGALLFAGCCAFVIIISSLINIRVIQSVNLIGAMRFLWFLCWIIPIELFFVIGLFDHYRTTNVWVKFSWRDPSMAAMRKYFCEPSSVANTLCAVPVKGNVSMENEWCLNHYNSTDCVAIRNEAQETTELFLLSLYFVTGGWGIILTILLCLIARILEKIISQPLVQKSTESNMPTWLLLPTISCAAVGSMYAFSKTSVLNINSNSRSEAIWIGPLFMIAGVLFFLGALLGWFMSSYRILSTTDKRSKSVAILLFIVIMGSLLVMLTVLLSSSVTFALSLVENPITGARRGEIACYFDFSNTCTGCTDPTNRCPEWTSSDVTKIVQGQAKASTTLAAISIVYTLLALRFGFNQRRHLSMYQIEYV